MSSSASGASGGGVATGTGAGPSTRYGSTDTSRNSTTRTVAVDDSRANSSSLPSRVASQMNTQANRTGTISASKETRSRPATLLPAEVRFGQWKMTRVVTVVTDSAQRSRRRKPPESKARITAATRATHMLMPRAVWGWIAIGCSATIHSSPGSTMAASRGTNQRAIGRRALGSAAG